MFSICVIYRFVIDLWRKTTVLECYVHKLHYPQCPSSRRVASRPTPNRKRFGVKLKSQAGGEGRGSRVVRLSAMFKRFKNK